MPGQGPYGDRLSKAVEFLLSCQQKDGLFARTRQRFRATYSHGITSLVVSELYGMSRFEDEARHRTAIEKALEFASLRISQPKLLPEDEGGWRYLTRHGRKDSDLSVTSWHVMFLRSAKNSGFDVKVHLIDDATTYIKRLYAPDAKTFQYSYHPTGQTEVELHRAMAGAGVLSMAMLGEHHSEFAKNAADFILDHPFDQYEKATFPKEYLCYAAFYASVGMFQMGGEYWDRFYPKLVASILAAQRPDGSWRPAETRESQFGAEYMTAMTVLALTPPYQMLPIFQR